MATWPAFRLEVTSTGLRPTAARKSLDLNGLALEDGAADDLANQLVGIAVGVDRVSDGHSIVASCGRSRAVPKVTLAAA